MDETIVVENGQAAVATTAASGTLSPKSSATDTIAVVDTPSGKQAAVVTTSVSGTLSPESSVTDTIAIVDTPSGKQAAIKVYNVGGGGGGEPATKFGVSIDNLLGEVDENGTYNFGSLGGASVDKFIFDGSGIKKVGWAAFQYAFTNNAGISEALFPDLEEINTYGFQYAFQASAITRITFGKVRVINANRALYNMVSSLSNRQTRLLELPIKNVEELSGWSVAEWAFRSGFDGKATGLYNLRIINGNRACYEMLGYSDFLEDIQLDSLESISGDAACQRMFYSCVYLKKAYFYSLTSVTPANALGLGTDLVSGIFAGCDGLKEIHFRADAKATIEALDGYADAKFGAYYATIYFDLIGTITVNGVAYSRNEPNSIRVDGNKTFVAWKDASNNIVYTNATAEPAVDTPVYSDAGTTQVGTVSEVA